MDLLGDLLKISRLKVWHRLWTFPLSGGQAFNPCDEICEVSHCRVGAGVCLLIQCRIEPPKLCLRRHSAAVRFPTNLSCQFLELRQHWDTRAQRLLHSGGGRWPGILRRGRLDTARQATRDLLRLQAPRLLETSKLFGACSVLLSIHFLLQLGPQLLHFPLKACLAFLQAPQNGHNVVLHVARTGRANPGVTQGSEDHWGAGRARAHRRLRSVITAAGGVP
mmetsp:Transcript_45708/g.99319  ORF Transcript_45708/g.99319 Transcript_45708/m.99319 type:complete len:221 (+) Transcript_45708:666-1328(+)